MIEKASRNSFFIGETGSGVDTLAAAIADRLEKVNGFGLRQVGDGPGDLQDTVIGARAELEAGDCLAQQKLPGGREPSMLLHFTPGHLAVGVEIPVAEPLLLNAAGRDDPFPDRR